MRLGYRRVSSSDQSLKRQDLPQCDRIFEEKISGAGRNRPELEKLLARVDEGDTVVVWSMDRLARSLIDLHGIIEDITNKGAALEFVSEKLVFRPGQDDPYAKFQMHVIGAVAELERNLIRRRQAEGIAKAKARGVYTGGRPRLNRRAVWQLLDAGTRPSDIADVLNIGIASVYRIKKERESADV